ncbi:MAG: type II secretion system protein [Moritella sp.]|uniref:type II secretion system protein n=1 Tax=Moritella sp. TaxID=78556 RepID=UPI001D65FA4D|nr:type II secretion system protein [Moritella sp.]NQZ48989.1 type II secretion system protein [Moritella sp.]
MKRNAGFTLIELVIVIIVLGILAATAVPKFINLQDDAKESSLKGVEAAIHSAANIVYSKAAIDGKERLADQTVADIKTEFGYPGGTADGIESAVELSGVEFTAGNASKDPATFYLTGGASKGLCTLFYTPATSGATYQVWFGDATTSAAKPTCG